MKHPGKCKMNMKKLIYIGFAVALMFTACKENVEEWHKNNPQTPPPGYEQVDLGARGYEVFNLVQEYYKEGNLYKENFPAQSGDAISSFLWPYNCLTTGAGLLSDLGYDTGYEDLIDGLSCYWMEQSRVAGIGGYGSSTNGSTGDADRFYDDNSIVGLSLLEAYERLGEKRYLKQAGKVVDFLKSGEDNLLGGGLWWNESLKNVSGNENSNKPTCANGYAVQFLLKYYAVCSENEKKEVINFAKRLYEWIKVNLRDDNDYCYWNSIDASGIVNKTKWTYNVGVMIQNGVCLYEVTGDDTYLNDAKLSAKGSYVAFVRSVNGVGMTYPEHDPWFNTKLLRGYIDLAKYEDDVKSYIDVYTDFINYGYDHARTAEGFFYEDWTGRESKRASQLLMQDAVIESYAVLALYYDEKD